MNPEEAAPNVKSTEEPSAPVEPAEQAQTTESPPKLQEVVEQAEEDEPEAEVREPGYASAEMKAYFSGKMPLNQHGVSIASNLSGEENDKMCFMLSEGYVRIADESLAVADLLQENAAVGREELKLKSMMERKAKLESELQMMEQALKFSPERSRHKDTSELSPPPEHKQFIERMMKARKASENRRKMKLEYETQRMEAMAKKEEEIEKEKMLKLKVEREEISKQRMDELKQRREAEDKESKEALKRYKSVMEQRKLYEVMEDHYRNTIVMPTLEERKKVLEQKRKLSKPIDTEQMHQFEEKYLTKRNEMLEQLESRRNSDDWHYEPPPVSDKLFKILEEERAQAKAKQEEKKRAIETKLSRQQAFNQYLKEKYPPKTYHVSTKRVSTPKKGKEPLPLAQKRQVGNMYLAEVKVKAQEAKKLKEQHQTMSARTQDRQHESRHSSSKSSHLKANTSMGNYKNTTLVVEHDTQRLNRIMSSNVDKEQKMKQLKLEAERLGQRAHRRSQMKRTTNKGEEADAQLEYLLGSIKAKVGIIDLYRRF